MCVHSSQIALVVGFFFFVQPVCWVSAVVNVIIRESFLKLLRLVKRLSNEKIPILDMCDSFFFIFIFKASHHVFGTMGYYKLAD